ncbi:MAG: IS256 family transposase [Acidobacteriaceae bacterium]|nr:IS256 family transposase [Acidobacteriaceae bacterium]
METTERKETIKPEWLDELLKDCHKPEDLLGEQGLLKRLTKALLERALDTELTHHLGYEKHEPAGYGSGNSRNGSSEKTLKGKNGEVTIEVPRDRKGTFEPQLVKKHQTRFDGFDEKILSLYARGMTTRDIQGHLEEIYGVEVSPTLISNVTDAVAEEVKAWQSRPLNSVYPIVYLDALHVKIRDAGHVQNRAIYVVIGINLEGNKEVLGLWAGQAEGAKFWLQVVTELKNRGVQDIYIACVDGLKGLPQAIETVFPKAQVQLCVVHLVRNSLHYVSWKERKTVAAELKPIYRAATAEDGWDQLEAFAEKWDARYPSISQIWKRNWEQVRPFFAYPAEIRKVIYTTNAVESLNMSLRKVIKTRGSFPHEEAALKLLYLGLERVAKKWTRPLQDWKAALNRFAIVFENRMPTGTLAG